MQKQAMKAIRVREFGKPEVNGTLRPIVGQEIPLSESPRAHEAVMKSGAYGKIVLIL